MKPHKLLGDAPPTLTTDRIQSLLLKAHGCNKAQSTSMTL